VQLYHTNWDSHGGPGENLNKDFDKVYKDVDQASAALVLDLKEHGMLEDTLVVWGGEFGRTPIGENRKTVGSDHHIDAFTMWMAGGGVNPLSPPRSSGPRAASRPTRQKQIPSS
jgi:uncharacterized protein (DUF1501 family)